MRDDEIGGGNLEVVSIGIPALRFHYRATLTRLEGRRALEIDQAKFVADVDPRAGRRRSGQVLGRREVPRVRRRRRLVEEPDLDDHGAGVAVVRYLADQVKKM